MTEKVLTSPKHRFAEFAGRVSAHNPPLKHHLANRTAKNGYRHIWLRAYALAPDKDSEFVRKYGQIWKETPENDRDNN